MAAKTRPLEAGDVRGLGPLLAAAESAGRSLCSTLKQGELLANSAGSAERNAEARAVIMRAIFDAFVHDGFDHHTRSIFRKLAIGK